MKEIFNLSQTESERMADLAIPFAMETWSNSDVRIIGDFAGHVIGENFHTATNDGIGHKLILALKHHRCYEAGFDLVRMQTNDLIRGGIPAKQLLPFISLPNENPRDVSDLMRGIRDACREVSCAVIGGETEVIKDVFKSSNEMICEATAVGWQKVEKVFTRSGYLKGDGVFILPSNGLHSNGWGDVVGNIHEFDLGKSLGKGRIFYNTFFLPTPSYVEDMTKLMEAQINIKGAEHVTGGGFAARLKGLVSEFEVSIKPFKKPKVFDYIQEVLGYDNEQMYNTFNMGAGMILIIDKNDFDQVKQISSEVEIKKIGELI